MRQSFKVRVLTHTSRFVPQEHRVVSQGLVEAVVPSSQAMELFQEEARRREAGERMLVSWFEEINEFSGEEQESASEFHVWVRRAHPNVLPTDDDETPGCPVCGLAEQAQACPTISLRKLPGDLLRSSNGLWYCSPRLGKRLVEESATGVSLSPGFFTKGRRNEFLRTVGLDPNTTLVSIPALRESLGGYALSEPATATSADFWLLIPSSLSLEILKETQVGASLAVLSGGPSLCGHTLGQRLLEPPRLARKTSDAADFSFTSNAIGLPKGKSLWRPSRELVVSRRLARVLMEYRSKDYCLEPSFVRRAN